MREKNVRKSVSLNQQIIDEITLFQSDNKCQDFSEALRLIISLYFKLIKIQKDEKIVIERISEIKDILDVMRRVLVNMNDKK